jgi:cell wall-associated NlpC family hydrolase
MPTINASRRRARGFVAVAFGAAALSALLTPAWAGAQSIDDKREQANKLEAEIDSNGVQLSALNEQIKTVQEKVDNANATIADAVQRIDDAKAEMNRIQDLVRQRVASLYRSSANGGEAVDIFELDIRTLSSREAYSSAASTRDNNLLDQLDAAREDLADRRADAENLKAESEKEKARLDTKKGDFEKAQAERQQLLDQVTGELESLVAEAAARRAAENAGPGPQPVNVGNGNGAPPPPGSGGAGAAVAYASAQLGKPYCYAGTGPDCYDCSGLTSMAWRAGGLIIPRTSGGQGGAFPRVSLSDLQPGDLVTTSSWGQHVGIWVGGGYVHATHTGSDIKFVSGTGSVVDAVRPS